MYKPSKATVSLSGTKCLDALTNIHKLCGWALIRNSPGSLLEKCVFVLFSTHCWSQNGPFSRHFGIFHRPKHITTGSKPAENTCLSIRICLRTTLEKVNFFPAPGTLVDPPLTRTVRRPGCPPAPQSDHWYGGVGGSLGDCKAWKPQKLGEGGWTTCLRNGVLSYVAQDTACPWFRGRLDTTAHIQAFFGHFWAVFRTYCGLRGQERALCHESIKAHAQCCNCCNCLAVLTGFTGHFVRKNSVLGHKMRSFGRAPPDSAPLPRSAEPG